MLLELYCKMRLVKYSLHTFRNILSLLVEQCNLILSSVNFPTKYQGWMLATDGWFLVSLVALRECGRQHSRHALRESLWNRGKAYLARKSRGCPARSGMPRMDCSSANGRITFPKGGENGMLARHFDIFFISDTDGFLSHERNIETGSQKRTQ